MAFNGRARGSRYSSRQVLYCIFSPSDSEYFWADHSVCVRVWVDARICACVCVEGLQMCVGLYVTFFFFSFWSRWCSRLPVLKLNSLTHTPPSARWGPNSEENYWSKVYHCDKATNGSGRYVGLLLSDIIKPNSNDCCLCRLRAPKPWTSSHAIDRVGGARQ